MAEAKLDLLLGPVRDGGDPTESPKDFTMAGTPRCF
jgi:hypothetical protein